MGCNQEIIQDYWILYRDIIIDSDLRKLKKENEIYLISTKSIPIFPSKPMTPPAIKETIVVNATIFHKTVITILKIFPTQFISLNNIINAQTLAQKTHITEPAIFKVLFPISFIAL